MNTAQPAITGFRRQRVTALRPEGASTACLLADGGSVLISPYVAGFIAAGDEIECALSRAAGGTEIRICRQSGSRPRELYLAPIGYVTQPKQDKRQESFLRADVVNPDGLGVRKLRQIGRWLLQNHPEVTSPQQWDRQFATQVVAAIDRFNTGDYSAGYYSLLCVCFSRTASSGAGLTCALIRTPRSLYRTRSADHWAQTLA